jgi:hypothetical protein
MKELMLRLRKNGEIVGYLMWFRGSIYRVHGKELPFSFSAWCTWGPMTSIIHDSFDFGIKENGEWHFEGDTMS